MKVQFMKIRQIPVSTQGGCAGSACGPGDERTLPEAIRRRVEDHPCYSEDAHHHFARMHVAVAPACNIQCNYCNRKFDCANESRPGVVSERLKPDQAIRKVLAVSARIPQLSVVGIAGPGDALANPVRSMATFRGLREQAPDLKLCLSTNGLALPDHVDELVALGVDHVTITINALDPEVGAHIYPWVLWERRKVYGVEGARILIERQQKGLEMLVDRGVLVKVNSVMIPGINDEHLREVSRVVKARGAFLHNIMPLISRPEHGTAFGLQGQRGPSDAELDALRDACGVDMKMMRHCRQCRADAVGLLGEDRGSEFDLAQVDDLQADHERARRQRMQVHEQLRERIQAGRDQRQSIQERLRTQAPAGLPDRPVLMAVASRGHGLINEHFGHAREFLVYRASAEGVRFVGHRRADLYCTGIDDCGEREQAMEDILSVLEDCEVLLCARIGHGPWKALEGAGITPNAEHAMEPIEEAVAAVYQQMLRDGSLRDVAGARLMADVS